jgi:hypothetical protein
MGALYKRAGSHNWMMAVTVAGKQVCKSTHTSNKRLAGQMLVRWETEVFEGRFHLPKSAPPVFVKWADDFLAKVTHPNTRKRYGSSVGKLKAAFTGARLSDISAECIDEYKDSRLSEGVEPATINHDLRVLRRMLRLAERKHLWLLKNSHSRSSQKFHRARMPYKRRSRFWWTFSIPPPGPFFQKRGFFNSHNTITLRTPQ